MSNLKTYYHEHNSTQRKIHSANGTEGLQQKPLPHPRLSDSGNEDVLELRL